MSEENEVKEEKTPIKVSLMQLSEPKQVIILSQALEKFGLELIVVKGDNDLILTVICENGSVDNNVANGIFSNWNYLFKQQWPEEFEDEEKPEFTVIAEEPPSAEDYPNVP